MDSIIIRQPLSRPLNLRADAVPLSRHASKSDTTSAKDVVLDNIHGTHISNLQTSRTAIGASTYNGNNNTAATFTGIVPDISGNITLSLVNGVTVGTANNYGYIGTLQTTAVPEPGTITLLGAAGLTVLVVYRRRREE